MMKSRLGFSLIEMAIVILFVSLAMVPILMNAGGLNDRNATGTTSPNISAVSGRNSKLLVAANSIMEKAQAGDTTTGFDSAALFAEPGEAGFGAPVITPRRQFHYGDGRSYNAPIEYNWVIRDLSYLNDKEGEFIDWEGKKLSTLDDARPVAPEGNTVIHAVLQVYENPGDPVPVLSLPTYFYQSTCKEGTCEDNETPKTGVVIVADRSGSMLASQVDKSGQLPAGAVGAFWDGTKWVYDDNINGIGAPFLRNRYKELGTNQDPSIRIDDLWDDANLDITYVMPFGDEDPTTKFTEEYVQPGTNASFPALDFPSFCNDKTKWDHPTDPTEVARRNTLNKYLAEVPGGALKGDTGSNDIHRRRHHLIERLCGKNSEGAKIYNGNQANGPTRNNTTNWLKLANSDISRMEALRNALLSLLITLENNEFVAQNTRLGLVTFSSEGGLVKASTMETGSKLEGIAPTPDKKSLKYLNMRRRAAMINRDGPDKIVAAGGTDMLSGLRDGAKILYGDKTLTQRVMIVVGDGAVNSGSTPTNCTDFAKKVGNGTYSYGGVSADGDKITIFTIGVIQADDTLMTNIAKATPNGQYFKVKTVGDMKPIFEQVSYQLERVTLLSLSNRYHLDPETGK